MGWCQLRRLAIHPDLASDLWCHHWMTPAVPRPLPYEGKPMEQTGQNLQLALSELLD